MTIKEMKIDDVPPTCNTGVEPSSLPSLTSCIDWVQATFKSVTQDELITHILGLKIDDFMDSDLGQFGYRKCLKMGNVSVYYDGNSDMGIHLHMSGQGCRQYESLGQHPWSVLFGMFLEIEAGFSRLDVAIDDFEGYFKISTLERKIRRGLLISKFKKARRMEDLIIKTGESCGKTLYYGSSKSDIQIRMYEKNHERQQAGEALADGVEVWNRTEIQARNDRADKIALIIAQEKDVGEVVTGILKHYLRFVVKGKDKIKSRWKTAPFWDKFLSDVEALKLTDKAPDRTIEKTEAWINKQVTPSLWALILAYEGDMSKVLELARSGKDRLKEKDYQMINRFLNKQKAFDPAQIESAVKTV